MNDQFLKLDNQLCFPLYASARLMMQAYRPYLEPVGLTYSQYLVLLVLWEKDGQTVSEIGERLLLDSGTLTPLLKRLQRDGILRRQRLSKDERSVENRLTAKGRKLKQKAASVPISLVRGLGMQLDEVSRMRELVRGLIPRLQRATKPA